MTWWVLIGFNLFFYLSTSQPNLSHNFIEILIDFLQGFWCNLGHTEAVIPNVDVWQSVMIRNVYKCEGAMFSNTYM
jgi:hypothetical protein